MTDDALTPEPTDPFLDLDAFVALDRHADLALSPDGERLIATITTLAEDRDAYRSALWELPTGREGSVAEPVRLTRGAEGESLVGFTRTGDILFTGKRAGGEEDDDLTALRLLPRSGGEARTVLRRPGGFSQVQSAPDADVVVLVADAFPSATEPEDDAELASARKDRKVSAILHESFPVRRWDHDLGPARPQLFVVEDPTAEEWTLRRLTSFGPEERLQGTTLTPDGTAVIAQLGRLMRGTRTRSDLVRIDLADGTVHPLASEDGHDLGGVTLSRDGSTALVSRSAWISDEVPLDSSLHTLDLGTGELGDRVVGLSAWAGDVVLSADGTSAYITTDHQGRGRIWHLAVDTGTVTALTDDDNAYSALSRRDQDGDLFALAAAIDSPPAPVVLRGGTGEPQRIGTPVAQVAVPGTLTEVRTEAADGTPLRAWLCLPSGASASDPAPTLLWIHGGPFGSWNSWTWRWNPWTATARGYAVLLPDPAISTGYGQEMIDRGWSELGGSPFDDIMRLTDAALEREDLDQTRTAAMGGSYGGYMANWVAGHTGDRFRCVVTHASLWALDQFRGTTDAAEHWTNHLTDRHNALFSPHDFVGDVEVPVLVIHGDKDYRVPIGEGLRLWYELLSAQNAEPGGNRHRFLYFPDEGHWILKPGNSAAWYGTVYAFLAQHVLGKEWERPERLG